MFAMLALAGDVGCGSGPTVVGYVTGLVGEDLKRGILAGVIFPVLLLVGIALLHRRTNEHDQERETNRYSSK